MLIGPPTPLMKAPMWQRRVKPGSDGNQSGRHLSVGPRKVTRAAASTEYLRLLDNM